MSNGVIGINVNYESNRYEIMNGFTNYLRSLFAAKGVQLGFNNRDAHIEGLQLRVFNSCRKGSGLQIGFWNNNKKRSLPILNWVSK